MFHWWFNHLSFILFLRRHFFWLPLGPWLMTFFLCITFCTWGYGFDQQVFELSFPSFLSPYHLSLCYILYLETILRPRDQTLSLIVFTWTSLCRLVEVWSLPCFILWEILLEAFGFSFLLDILMFAGFWVEDSPLMMLDLSFYCASDIHTKAYFSFAMRSLVVVGLCGYPWSWSLRCLIDVKRWLIDFDRCLVDDVMLCTRYPYWGIFPFCSKILNRG